ncbi:MAG: glycogen-binding domain-containing protein [Bacteroidales bacterium]|nr:glycogen-binding domain-containing protein [Bacteroidales bacterium]
MSRLNKMIMMLVCLTFSVQASGQLDPSVICRVKGDRIVYQLDLRWTDQQKEEISRLFGLDSMVIVKAYAAIPEFMIDSIHWQVKSEKSFTIELSRSIDRSAIFALGESDVLLLDDELFRPKSAFTSTQATYGVNRFTGSNIFSYEKEIACLHLPGNRKAEKVYLSGSFNSWSTSDTPMQKSDSGWTVCLKLPAGKYDYKYIVDGRWMPDPNNRNKENRGDGQNSYLFCYNHKFELKGYQDKRRVILAGSFNGWDQNELEMSSTENGWELPMYLKEGTHFYKFIADREWMTDPANRNKRYDSDGNLNSYIELGDTATFRLNGYTSARQVVLSGSFNNWSTNELPMNKQADGWSLDYVMAPGNYEYKFIVDGNWIPDPENPYTTGSGDYINSYFAFKSNYQFRLTGFADAKEVIVTGNFNNWNEEGYRMQQVAEAWILPIRLEQGKYIYKFIVDGKWILDPANKLWEENEYGTNNSVLWFAP